MQRSHLFVLYPIEFIAYMEEITEDTGRCEIKLHFNADADDIQLYANCRHTDCSMQAVRLRRSGFVTVCVAVS